MLDPKDEYYTTYKYVEQNEHQNDPFYHKINNTNDSIETSQDDSDKISQKYDMYPIKGPPEATAS